MDIITKAQTVFRKNFSSVTRFERAIFFSWYCGIGDCAYCYMSSQKHAKSARRSTESILAEVLLCKMLGWELGFVSGGHDAYTQIEFEALLKNIVAVHGQKVWVNVGALKKEELIRYQPYIKGVVGSIETVNPALHARVCPSKPVKPFERMFDAAGELGLQKAMTIIIGLGETINDFPLLEAFIKRHRISKVHLYSLNPQKGTVFENAQPPEPHYHAEWIARTRIAFPQIDIQAGIWLDRVGSVSLLLKAGANSISKFPAIRYFGSDYAKEIEQQAMVAGRAFRGTLTRLPAVDMHMPEDIDPHLKIRAEKKLSRYVATMRSAACHAPRELLKVDAIDC